MASNLYDETKKIIFHIQKHEKTFRPTVRMIILKDNKLLLCKMWKIWWIPGWWVKWWERLDEAFERESVEELWIKAILGNIIFTQDFIWLKIWKDNIHFLEYFCTVKNNEDFAHVLDTYKNSSHSHELQDLQRFSLDKIPETMIPQTFISVLSRYLKGNLSKTEYISWI